MVLEYPTQCIQLPNGCMPITSFVFLIILIIVMISLLILWGLGVIKDKN